MFRAKARILLGIALIGSTAAVIPETASADGMCSNGSVVAGGVQSYSYNLDSSLRAQFTLDTAASDVAMQVVDGSNNVACQTALPNPGHQSCGWTPVLGVTYTVNVLRAAAAPAVDPTATSDDPAAMTNIGQGADTSGDTSGDNSANNNNNNNNNNNSNNSNSHSEESSNSQGDESASGADTRNSASTTPAATADATPPAPPADFSLCYLQVN